MAILNRDGVSLYYEVYGGGPVILLTHGYSATSAMWHGQIDALSKKYKLVLWDMRGHGMSDYPEDQALYTEAATVADMAALLDKVGAERAIIGGLSLGGYMSLAFHLAFPARTRALLTIDTGPGFKNDTAREAWNVTARETSAKLESEGLAYLQQMSPERKTSIHKSAKGLARAGRGMLTQRDARVINSLLEIKVPALVVVGANDGGRPTDGGGQWRWRSQAGRPRADREVRDLIRQMSTANPLWGAPRIHGELLKLGIEISQATVAKYMVRRPGKPSPTWRTFLRNQATGIAAIDMFVVTSASFRLLYVMIILAHDRRKIVRFDITQYPTSAWLSRQVTEAFPWDTAPHYLLRDRATRLTVPPSTTESRQWDSQRSSRHRDHLGRTPTSRRLSVRSGANVSITL